MGRYISNYLSRTNLTPLYIRKKILLLGERTEALIQ